MKAIDNQKAIKEKKSKKIKRIIIDTVIFLVLLIIGILLLKDSIVFETEKSIRFNEKSSLDYKVYLQKNEFYEQEYLGKDMLYIASLIDKILIDFDYTLQGEDKENIDFDYKIVATLSINNQTGTRSYFEKSYVLLDNKQVSMKDATSQNIKETINLDYQYYNSLANSFKNQYGVDADSKLTVYMLVNKKNAEGSNLVLDDFSIMNIVIPLSERAIEIRLDYKEINDTNNVIKKEDVTFKNYIPLIIATLLILLSLVFMIKAIRKIDFLRVKKSEYDKCISKILKEYDRLIAETSTLLSFEGKEIISIMKFSELLDIHDNLQLPIIYYEVSKHKECYFYVSHDNLVYILKVDNNNFKNIK